MTTETIINEQSNTYNIIDSMGRPTTIYICASNIKQACELAKEAVKGKGMGAYYKVKRAYNGGVRG